MTDLAVVDDLHVRADSGRQILAGACLSVAPGEVVGLMGSSGSGKTTVALALLGRLRPGLTVTGGQVRVLGRDPFEPTQRQLIRRQWVSFLGQDPASELNPTRRIGSLIAERIPRGSSTTPGEILERLGLPAGFARRYVHQLSGGQARRAAVALAVVNRPRLLILDEPTAGLDREALALVETMIAERDDDCSVVVISHDHSALVRSADRLLHVDSGIIVAGAAPAPRRAPQALQEKQSRVILSAQGLTVSHGRRPVAGPVDLTVRAGRTTALVGPSGSGKTTLVRALIGLHPATSGTLRHDERLLAPSVGGRNRRQRRALQLVPQDAAGALNPHQTVRTAVRRALGPQERGAETARERIEELMALVGLDNRHLDRRPRELSGGERQRVAVARALACRPEVLLCDEITSALDHDIAEQVMSAIDRFRRDGGAVLMISHDLDQVDRWAHEVVDLGLPLVRDQ